MKKQFCRKELEAGTIFEISNEKNLVQCGKLERSPGWYWIDFNGVCIGTWYTWRAFSTNLDKLLTKYDMQDCEPMAD